MKIFISWSGTRSKAVAVALKEWLPIVLEGVEPFVSDKDITAGERWAQSIAGELEAANFGVICITPENLNADWILFESGALSKSMLDAKVIPLLFDLDFSDISGPLAQFQAKKLEKSGMNEVVSAINGCCDKPISEDVLNKRFGPLWATFEDALKKVPAKESAEKSKRTQTQVLEEMVSTVRSLEVRVRDANFMADSSGRISRRRRFHPEVLSELLRYGLSEGSSRIMLTMAAGFLREDAPWAAEVLLDANRDLNELSKTRRSLGVKKLKEFITLFERGHSIFRELTESKETYYIMREVIALVEREIGREEEAVNNFSPLSRRVLNENP